MRILKHVTQILNKYVLRNTSHLLKKKENKIKNLS